MILNYINWNANPEIFNIGDFSIRWYGLLFALGFYVGYMILKKMYIYEKRPVDDLDNLAMFMIIGSLIGARFGHCLFYEPDYYLSHPLDIIKPWTGELGNGAKIGIQGLASHGGAIGIVIALTIYSKIKKVSFLWLLDRIVIVTALGATFIRLGNLMNHEIVGMETQMPWGVVFSRLHDNTPRHPAQLYESVTYLAIFIYLIKDYVKRKAKISEGYYFGLFLVALFSARFFIEFIKESQVSFEDNMTLNMGQWLSLPFVVIGIFLIYRSRRNKANSTVSD